MPPVSGQWRGLDRLSRDPAFVARASAEFPQLAAALAVPRDRRGVLKLMAAGLALAGLSGCDDGAPGGVLIPPVLPPANTVSAGSHLFATASVVGGYANGILVRHVNGRPIKVEGNPRASRQPGRHQRDRSGRDPWLLRPGPQPRPDPRRRTAGMVVAADGPGAQRAAIGRSHGEGFRILTGNTPRPRSRGRLLR